MKKFLSILTLALCLILAVSPALAEGHVVTYNTPRTG